MSHLTYCLLLAATAAASYWLGWFYRGSRANDQINAAYHDGEHNGWRKGTYAEQIDAYASGKRDGLIEATQRAVKLGQEMADQTNLRTVAELMNQN
jgi:hypothetical protein